MHEPLAVTEAKPEFSWRDAEAAPSWHGVKQAAYQMRISASSRDRDAGGTLLWDSGKVSGEATSVHAYSNSGPGFESQHEYVWQVRVWDERDQPSAWSKLARWTQAPTWRARWIAADSTDAAAGSKPMPILRKEFSVTGQVKRALLYVSGLGQYELSINGAKAGNSELTPGWSDYRKTVFYDSYDVTAMVRSGTNAIGVMLGNGMYRVLDTPGRYKKFVGSFGPPQCIAQLHLELANGKSIDVVSDETWKTNAGPITFSSTYGGEDYDARREINGWDHTGFDDSKWDRVVVTDGPGGTLRPELAPPIRIMHTYTPIRRSEPKPGVVVYDLGQNFAGWPAISVRGSAGATVKLIPGELLNEDGTVSQRSSG
jgi:alpha-L-rhamnosidase